MMGRLTGVATVDLTPEATVAGVPQLMLDTGGHPTNSSAPQGDPAVQATTAERPVMAVPVLAIAVRFARAIGRKDGGGRAYRSMQQREGFSLDGKAETAGAHLPLHRRRGGR